jgi:WhiB family redox-sensing transcriptional regulator
VSRVDLDWQDDALCAQMPVDFVPDNSADSVLAKKVCELCEVRPECLAYAIANDERYGVWGGLAQNELRELTHEEEDEEAA